MLPECQAIWEAEEAIRRGEHDNIDVVAMLDAVVAFEIMVRPDWVHRASEVAEIVLNRSLPNGFERWWKA